MNSNKNRLNELKQKRGLLKEKQFEARLARPVRICHTSVCMFFLPGTQPPVSPTSVLLHLQDTLVITIENIN